jgi:hypothetical protein
MHVSEGYPPPPPPLQLGRTLLSSLELISVHSSLELHGEISVFSSLELHGEISVLKG